MTEINNSIIPTVPIGTLFSRLASDPSISIRWLTARDPVYFESYNRPMADLAVRQMIMAKSIDRFNQCLIYRSYFPFLVPPQLENGASVPLGWIWDMHVKLPERYYHLRLAYVIRLDGVNPEEWCSPSAGSGNSAYTGTIRLVFAASRDGDTNAYQMFYVDYDVNSSTNFQRARPVVDHSVVYGTLNNPTVADPTIDEYIQGQVTFTLLDPEDNDTRLFYDNVPPVDGGIGTYAVADASMDSYSPARPLSFGGGLLTDSAYNLDDNFIVRDGILNTSYELDHYSLPSGIAMDWHSDINVPTASVASATDTWLMYDDSESGYTEVSKETFLSDVGLRIENSSGTTIVPVGKIMQVGNGAASPMTVATGGTNEGIIDVQIKVYDNGVDALSPNQLKTLSFVGDFIVSDNGSGEAQIEVDTRIEVEGNIEHGVLPVNSPPPASITSVDVSKIIFNENTCFIDVGSDEVEVTPCIIFSGKNDDDGININGIKIISIGFNTDDFTADVSGNGVWVNAIKPTIEANKAGTTTNIIEEFPDTNTITFDAGYFETVSTPTGTGKNNNVVIKLRDDIGGNDIVNVGPGAPDGVYIGNPSDTTSNVTELKSLRAGTGIILSDFGDSIAISGSTSGGGITGVVVKNDGVAVPPGTFDTFNFADGITASPGTGQVNINVREKQRVKQIYFSEIAPPTVYVAPGGSLELSKQSVGGAAPSDTMYLNNASIGSTVYVHGITVLRFHLSNDPNAPATDIWELCGNCYARIETESDGSGGIQVSRWVSGFYVQGGPYTSETLSTGRAYYRVTSQYTQGAQYADDPTKGIALGLGYNGNSNLTDPNTWDLLCCMGIDPSDLSFTYTIYNRSATNYVVNLPGGETFAAIFNVHYESAV